MSLDSAVNLPTILISHSNFIIYTQLTTQRDILDLNASRKKIQCLDYNVTLDYVALTAFCFRLIRRGLEKDRAVADLGEHTDEGKGLRRRILHKIVQLVGSENFVENISLQLGWRDEHDILVCALCEHGRARKHFDVCTNVSEASNSSE